MRPTVEDRLARAGRTLDAAAPTRPADVMHPAASGGRRWVSIVAVMGAVAVVGLAVLVVRGAERQDEPADAAIERVAAALDATRGVPAMTVDVHGSWSFAVEGAGGIWNYGAPDRWEQMEQSDGPRLERHPPVGVTVRLFVGGRTWTVVEGRWREETPPSSRRRDPLAILDDLEAGDCAVELDEQLVVWGSGARSCPVPGAGMPGDLPRGTWVSVLILDADGRLREVRTGEVGDLGDGVQLQDRRDPLARVGVIRAGSARFWYENVPPVSAEPEE